jgi:hypothetical protein
MLISISPVRNSGIFSNSWRIDINKASALRCFRSLIFEGNLLFLGHRSFFLFFLSMTFPPVDRVCHAHIKNVFVFVYKKKCGKKNTKKSRVTTDQRTSQNHRLQTSQNDQRAHLYVLCWLKTHTNPF